VHDDIAGPCEYSGGGGERQHTMQCRRSPQKGKRQRCVRKAQRTASYQHTLPASAFVVPSVPVLSGDTTITESFRGTQGCSPLPEAI
jgi:hypothetical protein